MINEIRSRIEIGSAGEQAPLFVGLHGFGGGPQDFQECLPYLTSRYRVVLANLKNFFSSREPTPFRSHVETLNTWLLGLLEQHKATDLTLMGQSYGATLSIALRFRYELPLRQHVVLNPMPFSPFEYVRNPHLRTFMNFGFSSGDVGLFLKTAHGRQSLTEAAKIFRIGAVPAAQEIHHLNDRKLILVEKAIERFRWIDKNEPWDTWTTLIRDSQKPGPDLFLYSSRDPLFRAEEIAEFGRDIRAQRLSPIAHQGHLILQDMGPELLRSGRLDLPG